MNWLESILTKNERMVIPWPENPAATDTCGQDGRRSMMKCSSGVLVYMQVLRASTGPAASGK